jgi:hypothetical protein
MEVNNKKRKNKMQNTSIKEKEKYKSNEKKAVVDA